MKALGASPYVLLYNHITAPLSDLDRKMISYIPAGGNWQQIPPGLSARVDQIRERSERRGVVHTTYYGRLAWEAPAYTISTFFTRSGNGCFIHPDQDRLISEREAARLQSFPDHFLFFGPRRSVATQIGNAVPPLLGAALACAFPGESVVDLFAGAGGLSFGLTLGGKKVALAVESDEYAAQTYEHNHPGTRMWRTSLGSEQSIDALVDKVRELGGCDLVIGGPPCQSFSTAGHRAKDGRSLLPSVFVDAVRALNPQAFLMENVLGLRSFDRGRLLYTIVRDLSEAGYEVDVWDLTAERFGVPQKRRRLFVVGSRSRRLVRPVPILPAHRKGDVSFVTTRDAIGDLPRLEPGGGVSPQEVDLPPAVGEYQRMVRGEGTLQELVAFLKAAPTEGPDAPRLTL